MKRKNILGIILLTPISVLFGIAAIILMSWVIIGLIIHAIEKPNQAILFTVFVICPLIGLKLVVNDFTVWLGNVGQERTKEEKNK